MSMTRFGQSVVLACMAFAVALSGCTSKDDSGGLGGAEVNLTLETPPGGENEIINSIQADWQCEGNDPFTGIPRPAEQEIINVTTTEGDDPSDPKSRTGILSVRGQPVGACRFDFVAFSEGMTDGAPNVECRGGLDVNIQRDVNQDFLVTMVCIRQNQLGGGNFDALFDECPQIKQVVVSPTSQVAGGDIDVRTACYDPDGDDCEVFVQYVNLAGSVNPTNGNVLASCNDFAAGCEEDVRTVTGNEAGMGQIIVTVTDPGQVLCNGLNFDGSPDTAARQVIDVTYQVPAACGNGDPNDPGEECDPPSGTDANGFPLPNTQTPPVYCDDNCQFFDPCSPTDAFCASVADGGFAPKCAQTTCVSEDATGAIPLVCGYNFAGNETLCDLNGTDDGQCSEVVGNEGQCEVIPDCTANTPNDPACTGGTECQGLGDCNAQGQCVYDGTDNIGQDCTDDGAGNPGICQGAAGICTNPCDLATAPTCGGPGCTGCAQCETEECQREDLGNNNQGTCQIVIDEGGDCGVGGTCQSDGSCVQPPSCGNGVLDGPSTNPPYAGENCDDGNTDPIAASSAGGTFCDPSLGLPPNANPSCPQGALGQQCDGLVDPGSQACGDPGGSACNSNDDCPVEGQVCDTAQIGTPGTCIVWGDGSSGPCTYGDRTAGSGGPGNPNDRGQACDFSGVCLPKNPTCLPFAGDSCAADCLEQGKVLPTVCRNSFTNTLSPIPFFTTVNPNGVITENTAITPVVVTQGAVDPSFLQAAAITLFGDCSFADSQAGTCAPGSGAASQLTTVEVIAELFPGSNIPLTQGNVSALAGTTAGDDLIIPLPADIEVPVPFIPNPTPGGSPCNLDTDCPGALFSQSCVIVGSPPGTCEPCNIDTCAIIVTAGASVPIGTATGDWTADTVANGPVTWAMGGAVCDVTTGNPCLSPTAPPLAGETYIGVLAGGGIAVNLSCEAGVVNEAGTGCPTGGDVTLAECADDFIDPADPDDLINFPIWP